MGRLIHAANMIDEDGDLLDVSGWNVNTLSGQIPMGECVREIMLVVKHVAARQGSWPETPYSLVNFTATRCNFWLRNAVLPGNKGGRPRPSGA